MKEPRWLIKPVVLALHNEQLAEHGGQDGLRDDALLESALERARNLFSYGSADIFDLAAAYAFGLAMNHAFIDGNKRASLAATAAFLLLNGYGIEASDADTLRQWLALASGRATQDQVATWLRAHCKPHG